MNEVKVMLPEHEVVVGSTEGKKKGLLQEQLEELLRRMFQGLSLQRASKKLKELQDETGELEEGEIGLLKGFQNLVKKRGAEIDDRVGEIFQLLKSNQPNSADNARSYAEALLEEYGGNDVAFAVGDEKHGRMKDLVKGILDKHTELDTKTEGDRKDAVELLRFETSVMEVERKAPSESKLLSEADKVIATRGRAEARKGVEALKDRPELKRKWEDIYTQQARDKLESVVRRRLGVNNQEYREFMNGISRVTEARDIEKDIVVQAKIVQESINAEIKGLDYDKKARSLALNALSEAYRDLDRKRRTLNKVRADYMVQDVDQADYPMRRILRDSGVIEVDGKELYKLTGSRKLRVFEALDFVGGTDESEDQDILVIAEALVPGTRNSREPRVLAEARKILERHKEWERDIATTEKGILQLQEITSDALLKNREYSRKRSGLDVDGNVDGLDDRKWMKMHTMVVGYTESGDPIYTAEGQEKRRFLDRYEIRIDEEGKLVAENDFVSSMARSEGMMTREQQQQRAVRLRNLEARLVGKSAKERQDIIHDRIEEVIHEIFRTEDSSREPANQMNSWELYDLIGRAEVGDVFKNLWMARLALYDVSVFSGSAEDYESWAKIASFMPKEFLSMLFDHDKIEHIFSFTKNGDTKHVHLEFKDILGAFEHQVVGSKRDQRDIWLGEILGSKDLGNLSLNKKRFLAYVIGQQMGVEVSIDPDGKMIVTRGDAMVTTPEGLQIHIFNLAGLNSEGREFTKEEEKLPEYEVQQRFDLSSKYMWYINNAIIFQHMTLKSVELERGGGSAGWWKYMPNILRKIHGGSQSHYFNSKDMGMVHVRNLVDSMWRSFYGWRMFSSDTGLLSEVNAKVGDRYASREKSKKVKKFTSFLKEVAYASDYKELEGVNGSTRSNADVRFFASDAGRRTKAFKDIELSYGEFDPDGTFDWTEILTLMGVDERIIQNAGGSVIGRSGMELFLKHYNVYGLLNFKGLDHNWWKDHIKYSGNSYEYFGKAVPLANNPASDDLIAQQGRHVEGYLGTRGMEVTVSRFYGLSQVQKRPDIRGYKTNVGKDGNEKSEKWTIWKVDKDGETLLDSNGNKIIDEKEVRNAEKLGLRVNRETGLVVDQDNVIQYRPGRVGYLDGAFDPFRPWSHGSPYMKRALPKESWKEQKSVLKTFLRNRLWSPERYMQENMKFNVRLFTDVSLDKLPKNKVEFLKIMATTYLKNPLRMIYIFRGLWILNPLVWEDLVELYKPLGKELSTITKY